MGKPGSDLLFYILIIGGFLLFNYLARQMARKAREQQEAAEREAAAREAEAAPVDEDVLEDIWMRPSPPVPVPEPRARIPAPAAQAPQPAAAPARVASGRTRRLFRDRRELRHAIVTMTVLGPCRALEPFERR